MKQSPINSHKPLIRLLITTLLNHPLNMKQSLINEIMPGQNTRERVSISPGERVSSSSRVHEGKTVHG